MPRERGSSRTPPPGPPGSRGGRLPGTGGLGRRCSYRSSPRGRHPCSSMAAQASTSPGGTCVDRGRYIQMGPRGVRAPCSLAPWLPPNAMRISLGKRMPMANPGSSCSRRAPRRAAPRAPTSDRAPASGPELRRTGGRSRTPSGGDVPGDTWAYRDAPPGRRTGMLPGIANGNSTSAHRIRRVGGMYLSLPAPGHRPVRPVGVRRAARRRRTGAEQMLARGARLEQLLGDGPGVGAGPGGAPPRDEYRPGSPRVVRPLPVGRSPGTVRRGCPRGDRWGEGFAWDGPPSGDVARRYRRLVPRGQLLPGGASPGSSTSVYRSGCVGDGGTCTRPPRGPGEPPWLPPWCPVGERRGGRRVPRRRTGPRLEELVPRGCR
jgi:hypothetical protein